MKNPVIVALDVDSPKEAEKLFQSLRSVVGGFKVGPRLTFRCDKSFLKDISQSGVLFFDHKFFDIPSTTSASVEVAAELGAHWVTVHALNGPGTLEKLAETEVQIRRHRADFRVLVVTVLTSFSEKALPPIWKSQSINDSVAALAESADLCGLHSFVCSPEEIQNLKSNIENSFLVVPGIRPVGSDAGDQHRTATPHEALKRGANALVIGRPIISSKNPLDAAKAIVESL